MKTIEEIYREMQDIFTQRTGLEAGASGDLAVRFYAVAAQIHALYLQAAWTERQCFPQTATGDYLDYHAQLRGVTRKKAAKAEGVLRFTAAQVAETERIIPAGTVCMTAGLVRFETAEDGVIPAGELSADIPARAVEPGTAGNAAAGTILTMAVAPTGVAACTNPEAFSGGTEDEEDEVLRVRVLETYQRLANGANAAFYQQKAMDFEGVSAVSVLPRSRGVGTVDVIVAGPGGLPEQEVLDRVQEYFQSVREIAVDVQALAPEVRKVDVSVRVKAEVNRDQAAVLEQVRQAVSGWFNGQRLGKAVLRARLGDLVFNVDGVENYTLISPAADLTVEKQVLPVLGELTVEAMD